MKERVINNWKTSVLGLVLLAFAGVLVWFGKITWGEFVAFIPTVAALLWAKDTFLTDMFKKGSGGAAVILIMLMMSGCVTYNKCVEKYGLQGDSVRIPVIIQVPVAVPVKADSNQAQINIDKIKTMTRDSVYHKMDSASKIQISYWIDKYNNLNFKAFTPADTIRDTLQINDTITVAPPVDFVKKPGGLQQFWQQYKNVAAWGFLITGLLMILFIIYIIKNSLK